MVDYPLHELEWAKPYCQEAERHPRDGCLLNRVGCSVPRRQDRRSLVPEGEGAPYQCLELLAAFLAFKCFLKDKRGIHVLLKMDNTSAVAYINKLGGTVSPALNKLNKEFWLWCMERDISVQAQHLAGELNCTADEESRVMNNRSDWLLCPSIFHFHQIIRVLGPLEVDLFASRLFAQLPSYVSWNPDSEALATDAFTVSWTHWKPMPTHLGAR